MTVQFSDAPLGIRNSRTGLPAWERKDFHMSADSKKSTGWMGVLIFFGLVALFGGVEWLVVLIPAAMVVWYGVGPSLRTGRN